MEIRNVAVYGLIPSLYRSGYPMTVGDVDDILDIEEYNVSPQALNRAKRLSKAPNGYGHDNFLKGIIVQFDLKYPEYFSPQLQRYKFIDIISSQSKMHKLASRELTVDDFTKETPKGLIVRINSLIELYNKNKSKDVFRELIGALPSGYMKWMAISTNYLQLKTIYSQRKNHKLSEWKYFCNFIETLPESELIINKK